MLDSMLKNSPKILEKQNELLFSKVLHSYRNAAFAFNGTHLMVGFLAMRKRTCLRTTEVPSVTSSEYFAF